jgi:DivIVA domain-containing protein
MSDRRREQSSPSPIDADALARHSFSSSFRGYDIDEVRAYLLALAEDVRAMNEHTSWLTVELADAERRATAHVELDENRLTELLGEETTRVLATAREAAASTRARAEAEADRVVAAANEQASAIRTEALSDAIRHRERAETAALAEVEAAKAHGRQLITDAQALRERVLADLARRRDAGRAQIAHLKEGRDRLLGAYEVVRRTLEQAVDELRSAAPQARAIDVAAEAVALAPAAASDEDETEGIRILTPIVRDPEPEPGPEPEAEVVVVVEQVVVDDVVVEEVVAVAVVDEGAGDTAAALTEEITEENPVIPEDPTLDESVDDLFARIRAARADEVAKAEEVLAEPPAEPPADSPGDSGSGMPETATESGSEPTEAVDVFEQRAAALVPMEASLTRKLRRVLADEQNEALDRLRQGSKVPALETLVGSPSEHGGRYADAARADLHAAAQSGAELLGHPDGGSDPDLDDVMTGLGAAVGEPLRERLAACLSDAGGDLDEATELVRAAYREWKTQRLGSVATDALLAAFSRGAFHGAPEGCTLRWLVAPDQPPCPDADDNALAGDLARGQPFPTGHLHAPAHPGCRCQVVIVPR